jgi:hypothetical protein
LGAFFCAPLSGLAVWERGEVKHRGLARAVPFMKLKGYVAMSNPLPFVIPCLIIVALLLIIMLGGE